VTQAFNETFGELRSAGEARDVGRIHNAIDKLRSLDLEQYNEEAHDRAIDYLIRSGAVTYATTERLEAVRVWVQEQLDGGAEEDDEVIYPDDIKAEFVGLVLGIKSAYDEWLDLSQCIEHVDGLITRSDIKDTIWLILKRRGITIIAAPSQYYW
jgi:hypothetical protein